MLVRHPSPGKTGYLFLLLSCLCLCGASIAASSPAADTTVTPAAATAASETPAPATATKDTTNFIVYDYATASFINNQFLPIDRAFNIKIINIPPDSSVTSVTILEFEGRHRRNKYIFKNGELVGGPEIDSLTVYRRILCQHSGITPKKGEQIFLVPKHLIPNREYVVSIGNSTTRKLNDAERATFIVRMTPILQQDAYFRTLFNATLTRYFKNPRITYASLSLSQDSLAKHLKRLVTDSFPNYAVFLRSDSLPDQELANSLDAVKNLKFKLDDLVNRGCLQKDAPALKELTSVNEELGNKRMDWYGLSEQDGTANIHAHLGVLNLIGDCAILRDLALKQVDSIAKYIKLEGALAAVRILVNEVFNLGTIEATYFIDIAKNAQRNVTIDLGAGYSWSMDRPFLYTAINVYFRPIDKNLPLRNTNYSFWDYIGSHASLLVGMTLTSVNKDKIRDGILGNKGLILGSGFRFLPWFKVSGGTLLYYGLNENPLNSSRRTRFTPFVSMSIDVDVKTIFKSFPIIDEALFK